MKWMILVVVSWLLAFAAVASSTTRREFSERLQALRSTDPASYFELGEEIAEIAADDEDRQLAIRLFTLADSIDPHRWRSGAILAIRPLVREGSVHRLLDANLRAWSVSRNYLPSPSTFSERDEKSVLAAVDALSALRRGDAVGMRELLRTPGAPAQLDVVAGPLPGGSAWMAKMAGTRGFGRAMLSERELKATLQAQAELLGSGQRPWSIALQAGAGKPMTVIDPIPLSEIFGVDVTQTLYEKGKWSRPAGNR